MCILNHISISCSHFLCLYASDSCGGITSFSCMFVFPSRSILGRLCWNFLPLDIRLLLDSRIKWWGFGETAGKCYYTEQERPLGHKDSICSAHMWKYATFLANSSLRVTLLVPRCYFMPKNFERPAENLEKSGTAQLSKKAHKLLESKISRSEGWLQTIAGCPPRTCAFRLKMCKKIHILKTQALT